MYKNLLFDLDGTLTDSMEGITKSVQYSLKHYGIDEPDLNNLICFIGPPLRDSYMKFYGFDEQTAVEAVHVYRERYETIGIYEYKLYDGIEEMLKKLKSHGKRIILSTAKPTVSAVEVIKHAKLDKYFDFMLGSDKDGPILYKHQVIAEILRSQNITNLTETVMIGDKADDALGAEQNGIDCIGVRYGFGADDELKKCIKTVNDVFELTDFLLKN